jgi:apolipoprotein N-acyltransferase
MVRAANTGVTCFINEFGNITQMLLDENGTPFTQGTLTGQVAVVRNPELTFYVRHGEWFTYSCVVVMTLTLAFLLVRRVIRRPR